MPETTCEFVNQSLTAWCPGNRIGARPLSVMRRWSSAVLPAILFCVLAPADARPQAPTCDRLRAELRALDSRGPGDAVVLARRQVVEYERTIAYYRSVGCASGIPYGYGGPHPAQCEDLADMLRAMEDRIRHFDDQARRSAANFDARRRQLQADASRACAAPQPSPEPRRQPDERRARASSNAEAFCVRTCDGYAFPLANLPVSPNGPDEMCQALCPNAETAAFLRPRHGDIGDAVSLGGMSYRDLPNAFAYRSRVDPACACKRPGESWARALADAEALLGDRGDEFVTEEDGRSASVRR